MLITKPGGEITVVHTLKFADAAQRKQFHEYANTPDGLPVARGAPGNLFVSPYDSLADDGTVYMFSRWETEEAWDAYSKHRIDISPDWFLPMMEPQHILRLRELDSSPTKKGTQAPFFGAPAGSVCNFHIWQFDDTEFRNMFAEWYFMRALTADAEMVLAKADLGIAELYSKLAGPLHDKFFPIVKEEFELTRDLILEYSQHHELLEGDVTLQRAIMLRNPYVDPMSLMQVDLLERWRTTGSVDTEVFEALLASVNGIAQGLQNTG